MEKLSTSDIVNAALADWRKLAQALHARFPTQDYRAGASFVAAVADEADRDGHRPVFTVTGTAVDISLCTHEDGLWVTPKDIKLAHRISEIAREHALVPEPSGVSQLELALDTADEERVGPFWSALLTGSPDNQIYDSVFDPTERLPALWFQATEKHETPRQRWHFDLWLAPEVADDRIRAALAAGGTLIYDGHAPSFTVLADPDGNRVCICTALNRD